MLRTLCLPRNQANILVMTLGFFLLLTHSIPLRYPSSCAHTLPPPHFLFRFFAVKLLPGDLGANSLAVLYGIPFPRNSSSKHRLPPHRG